MNRPWDPEHLRALLRDARIYLVWTPSLCRRDPLEALEAALPFVDLVQVRPKAPDRGLDPERGSPGALATTSARELHDWTVRALDLLAAHPERDVPVLANDRVDVALSLRERGCAGVHLGQEDAPPRLARELLGPAPLVGLSTHSLEQVARAREQPVDYLGFGPFRATRTKGYERGLGPGACWVAHRAAHVRLFPIGGIDATNVEELSGLRGAAVGAAILSAEDPARAARLIRELLEAGPELT